MKITKQRLKEIIKEELNEERFSPNGRPFKVANKGNIIKDIIS